MYLERRKCGPIRCGQLRLLALQPLACSKAACHCKRILQWLASKFQAKDWYDKPVGSDAEHMGVSWVWRPCQCRV